jgi:hypothetical protein
MGKEVVLMQIIREKRNFREVLKDEFNLVSLSLNSQIFRGFDFTELRTGAIIC